MVESLMTSNSNNSVRREVDFYLNPTELFRWINYRRWDGATARAKSNPEESGTWIVSKNSDGSINWRHLPIHLVCMQCSNVQPDVLPELEVLVDALILAYPEGASEVDSQGMLPIHVAVTHGASEKILNALCTSFPGGSHVKDKFGRTPIDIVNNGPSGARRDGSLRILQRALNLNERVTGSIRREAEQEVSAVHQSAANERVASQRIIMRLEEELKAAKTEISTLQNEKSELKERESSLEQKLHSLESVNQSVADEKRETVNDLRTLRQKVQEHESIVASMQRSHAEERAKKNEIIANLKSDVNTAKAMSDAVETQLRSRFSNEEHLTSRITQLEDAMAKEETDFENEKSELVERISTLESENDDLKKNVEDLTKRNSSMQTRVGDLTKQLNNLLASHHSLNIEHERVLESSARYEHDLMESMQQERSKLRKNLSKAQSMFENMMAEQSRILEDSEKNQNILSTSNLEDRERSMEIINEKKSEFKAAIVAERERKIKEVTRQQKELQQMQTQQHHHHSRSSLQNSSRKKARPPPSSSSASSSSSKSSIPRSRIKPPNNLNSPHVVNSPSPFRDSKNKFNSHQNMSSPGGDSTIAPQGDGHLMRLLEDRNVSKTPNRSINSGLGSSYDDFSSTQNSSVGTGSTSNSIGYSFYKQQRADVRSIREKYAASPIDERGDSNCTMMDYSDGEF